MAPQISYGAPFSCRSPSVSLTTGAHGIAELAARVGAGSRRQRGDRRRAATHRGLVAVSELITGMSRNRRTGTGAIRRPRERRKPRCSGYR